MAVKDRKVETSAVVLRNHVIIPLLGTFDDTNDRNGIATFYNGDIWIVTAVKAACRAKSNLDACTIDVKDDGVSLFSSLPDLQSVAAGAAASGTLNGGDKTIAANSKITIDLFVNEGDGGGDIDDITVTIYYRTQGLGEAS